MGTGRRLRVAFALSALVVGPVAGCLSFGDLSGGGSSDAGNSDAAAQPDVTTFDAADSGDSSSVVSFASCAAAHAALPSAPDGVFSIASDDGGAPFQAFCDMTNDDGGWMLVTPSMIVAEPNVQITAVHGVDENGGLVLTEFPDSNPCGNDAGPVSQSIIIFSAYPRWSQIRARYTFDGSGGCWSVFGAPKLSLQKNTVAFDSTVDAIYDQKKMGGVLADGGPLDDFSGNIMRCDSANDNFWSQNASSERTAVLILRRDLPGPAGLATSLDCLIGSVGPTATSHWGYRDIYVR